MTLQNAFYPQRSTGIVLLNCVKTFKWFYSVAVRSRDKKTWISCRFWQCWGSQDSGQIADMELVAKNGSTCSIKSPVNFYALPAGEAKHILFVGVVIVRENTQKGLPGSDTVVKVEEHINW